MYQNRGALVAGALLGAGIMYLLDPDRGTRRRALVRDKLVRAGHAGSHALGVAGRDLGHRCRGLAARTARTVRPAASDDDVLVERVRAQLGRLVSHPRAIDVHASNGVVILRGPVLRSESAGLLAAIERVRGVRSVTSELDEHATADVPSLQGGVTPPSAWGNLWPGRWSPATRLLTGTAATLAAIAAARNAALWQELGGDVHQVRSLQRDTGASPA